MTTKFTQITWICDIQNSIVCKGSGGGTTTNTVTSSAPPAQVLQAYQTAMNGAQTASSAPLQQYTGSEIAGFTPDQLQAFQTTANTAGAYNPYLSTANQDIQAGTTPLWSGVQQFSPSAVNQYQSPYTQDVLQTTQAAENNQDAQQQQQVEGNAISSGAWGGDRSAVAQAQLAGQQDIANNATNAGIENTGYSTALGEFNTQQQSQLSANEANSYLNEQAGFGQSNLGTLATSLPLEQANAEANTGATEQNLGQEALNVPYEQFEQQQAYPFQTAQYFADLAEGIAPGEGQSGTSSTTAPAASTSSQLLGGGLGLGSLAYGLSEKSGGRIPRDSGGLIPNFDINIVPTTNSPGTKLLPLPSAPRTSSSGSGQSATQMGQSLQGLSDIGGQLSSIFGSGGSSAGDLGGAASMLGSSGEEEGGDEAGEMLGDIMKSGGAARLHPRVPQYRKSHAIGGEVLPDVVSGIGDIVGAIFGDPGAGDQAVGITSAIDGGRTEGEGIEGRAMGSLFGDSNEQGGFRSGGRTHYDDGGSISPVTGAQPSAATANPYQQNAYSQISQMPMDKLQELQVRFPPNSPQGAMVQKAIKQKQFQPAAAQPQAGLSSAPQGPQAAQQLQNPLQMMQPNPAASGGRQRRDDGGSNLPIPPTSDEVDLQNEVANEPQAGLSNNVMPSSTYNPPSSNTQTVQNYQPPSASNENKPTKGSASVSPWEALAVAGFGMMAGTSPQAGVNIGRGALYGMQNLEEQKKQVAQQNYQEGELGLHGKSVDTAAQELADKVDQEKWARTNMTPYQQAEADKNTWAQTHMTPYEQAQINTRNEITPYQQAQIDNMKAERQKPIPDGAGGFLIPNLADPTHPTTMAGAAGSSAPPVDPATGQPMTGETYLATLPPERAAQIKAMDEGRMNFPTGLALRSPYFQHMLNQLYQYNPEASAQTATAVKAFNTGQQGNQTRFLNVAVDHLGTLDKLTDALQNHDVKALNSIGNYWQSQTGSTAPTNFNTAKQIVGDEVTKAVLGAGGTGADREKAQSVIDAANSPEQLKGAIKTYQQLMTGQLNGLKQQYETSTGRKDYDKYLTGNAKAALMPAQQPTAIPPMEQRQVGQTYQTPKGPMTWQGTGWQPTGGANGSP